MPTHTPAEIIALLRTEGVEVKAHELGLMAHAPDPVAYYRALQRCQPTVLRVLTMQGDPGIDVAPPCTNDPYVCNCPEHSDDRVTAIKRGRRDVRQPWDAQPSRRAA